MPSPGEPGATRHEGRCDDGTWWVEATVTETAGGTLRVALRCTGAESHDRLAQRVCDRTGWIAFTEAQALLQPSGPR